jgi:type III secretion system low calcium response chaperone LcrH/SycD
MNFNSKIDDVVKDLNTKIKGDMKQTLTMLTDRVFNKGMRPKVALNLSDNVMEGIYTHAYNFYNRGLYKEAIHIFRLLTLLDPLETKFLIGLAACLHMQKKYEQALQIYLMAGFMKPANPIPFYHASDCYIHMDAPMEAVFVLEKAVEEAGDQPAFQAIKERSILMIESIKAGGTGDVGGAEPAKKKKKKKKTK